MPAKVTGVLAAVLMCSCTAWAVPQGVGPLIWQDEFGPVGPLNQNILDLTKWGYRGAGPRDEAFYTPDAVSVDNGVLTIQTYTDAVTGTHFTGMIGTQNLFEQTYGYFEARVKFRTTSGQWSAFWLQSPTIGNPQGDPETAGVEMDIFEHRVHNSFDYANYPGLSPTDDISNRVNQATIWDGYGPQTQVRVKLSDPLPGLANDTWHTFGLKWSPDGYTFYYDDQPTWDGRGLWGQNLQWESPVSRRSQYIILSSHVASFFAGAIPAGGYGPKDAGTTDFQVDYVRVYEVPEPTGLGTLGLCAVGVLSRRRRSVYETQ